MPHVAPGPVVSLLKAMQSSCQPISDAGFVVYPTCRILPDKRQRVADKHKYTSLAVAQLIGRGREFLNVVVTIFRVLVLAAKSGGYDRLVLSVPRPIGDPRQTAYSVISIATF